MFEIFGWMGSLCLALCAAPQAWMSWRQGHSNGIASGFLWLWCCGEVFALMYVLNNNDAPMIFNYLANILFTAIIVKYKLFPRKTKDNLIRTGP